MQRIKKGDTVQVVAGRKESEGGDRGKTGEVLRVIPDKNQAVVQGVNVRTKHQKPSMTNPQGGIIKQEMPVDMSKLMPVDPATKKPTRVKIKTLADGTKVRVAKSGEQLDK
ncbi:MAG: 50S ribosomal protein L24 [Candidatus Sericytochromatia bacterium]|nr:50S ribosomal protein L24 [Candidatus Sericytochromatia bacterium]